MPMLIDSVASGNGMPASTGAVSCTAWRMSSAMLGRAHVAVQRNDELVAAVAAGHRLRRQPRRQDVAHHPH